MLLNSNYGTKPAQESKQDVAETLSEMLLVQPAVEIYMRIKSEKKIIFGQKNGRVSFD